jgi:hypothetical protein
MRERPVPSIQRVLRTAVSTEASLPSAKALQANILKTGRKTWLAWLILAIAMLPSLAWVLMDRTVWPWDQAWYGFNSVSLFYSLRFSPNQWINDLISACIAQPPAISWLGQFFVPMSQLTGGMDSALLLSIILTNLLSLIIIHETVLQLSQGSKAIALTSALLIASGPLFIALSHQYFAESFQLLIVSWIILIMSRASTTTPLRLLCHLILAGSLGMAAKASTPLYCLLPGVTAIAIGVHRRYQPAPGSRTMGGLERLLLLGGLLTIPPLVINWYQRNWDSLQDHIKVSSTAEFWGSKGSFFNKFPTWAEAFGDHFFIRLPLFFAIVMIIVSFVYAWRGWLQHGPIQTGLLDLAAVISILQIMAALSAFSLVPNEERRYLLPLAPYVAILAAWCLKKLPRIWTFAAIVVFTVQLLVLNAEALGIVPLQQNSIPWLSTVNTDDTNSNQVSSLIAMTCEPTLQDKQTTEVAVDMNNLNNFSLNYRSASLRQDYLGLRVKPCDYINSLKLKQDLKPLVESIRVNKPSSIVTVKDITRVPTSQAPNFTNTLTPKITKEFAARHGFVPSSEIKKFAETSILIYKPDCQDLAECKR